MAESQRDKERKSLFLGGESLSVAVLPHITVQSVFSPVMATPVTMADDLSSNKKTREEVPDEEPNTTENVLSIADEISDVILEVEGRQLHASRAVLAHYSPVFRTMFFSDFKEKSGKRVPLPEKNYEDMVMFFSVLYPRSPASKELITDDNLIQLLTLADEYETDQVKVLSENYIGEQLAEYFFKFYSFYTSPDSELVTTRRTAMYSTASLPVPKDSIQGQGLTKHALIKKLLLYFFACDEYELPKHRGRIKSMLVTLVKGLNDVSTNRHYQSLSSDTRIELLETLCRKFDGSSK